MNICVNLRADSGNNLQVEQKLNQVAAGTDSDSIRAAILHEAVIVFFLLVLIARNSPSWSLFPFIMYDLFAGVFHSQL